jgi:hypothetical protein
MSVCEYECVRVCMWVCVRMCVSMWVCEYVCLRPLRAACGVPSQDMLSQGACLRRPLRYVRLRRHLVYVRLRRHEWETSRLRRRGARISSWWRRGRVHLVMPAAPFRG